MAAGNLFCVSRFSSTVGANWGLNGSAVLKLNREVERRWIYLEKTKEAGRVENIQSEQSGDDLSGLAEID